MLIIIISSFLIVLFTYKIINRLIENRKKYTIELSNGFGFTPKYIFVPVVIKNKVYRFIIDTGASVSILNTSLKNELHLQEKNELVDISTFSLIYTTLSFKPLEKVKFKLGGKTFSHTFYYNSEKGADDTFDGLLGMDILNQFNWFFAVKDNEIRFSKQKFEVDGQNQLKLNYESREGGTPNFNIHIDDTISAKVLFDTGYISTLQINNSCFIVDLFLNKDAQGDSIINYLHEKYDPHHLFRELKERENIAFHISPKLNINGFTVDRFVTLQSNDSKTVANTSLFSVQFLNRFDKVYLFTKTKEFIFCK